MKKHYRGFPYIIIFWLLLEALLLAGCSDQTAKQGHAEAATTTQLSSILTDETDQSEPSDSQTVATTAVDYNEGELLPEESAFYGELCPIAEDIKTLERSDALSALGMDKETQAQALLRYYDGRGYFTIDLSQLEPLWVTPEGEIVCKHRADPQASVVFLLDAQTPQSVSYFVRDGWTIREESHIILLDDRETDAAELELCEALLQIHLNSGEAERCYYLDGNEQIHHMVICFPTMEGLQYHVRFDEYPGEDHETAIYSISENAYVWTGIQMVGSIGELSSDRQGNP